MSERRILHSDADCFYASVETVLDPTLRGKPIAVCGSTSERHGIVLAKSYIAKRAGIRTGMTNAEAKKRCPSLIIVPPHFERYSRFPHICAAYIPVIPMRSSRSDSMNAGLIFPRFRVIRSRSRSRYGARYGMSWG